MASLLERGLLTELITCTTNLCDAHRSWVNRLSGWPDDPDLRGLPSRCRAIDRTGTTDHKLAGRLELGQSMVIHQRSRGRYGPRLEPRLRPVASLHSQVTSMPEDQDRTPHPGFDRDRQATSRASAWSPVSPVSALLSRLFRYVPLPAATALLFPSLIRGDFLDRSSGRAMLDRAGWSPGLLREPRPTRQNTITGGTTALDASWHLRSPRRLSGPAPHFHSIDWTVNT